MDFNCDMTVGTVSDIWFFEGMVNEMDEVGCLLSKEIVVCRRRNDATSS